MTSLLVLLTYSLILNVVLGKNISCSNANALESMSYNQFLYTLCGSEESPRCISSNNYYSCNYLDFYSSTGTDVDICGCNEDTMLSNIIVLVDGTNHTSAYSWYYWATSWIKLWYYDITRSQPLLNITFIYYGSNVEYIKKGNPVNFFEGWKIPAPFIDDVTPNLCNAFDTAINIFDQEQDDERKKLLIILSNTTPNIPNNNILCSNNFSKPLNDINIFAIKSSPNVNLNIFEQEYGSFDACLNIFEEYNPNWASYFDETDFSYKPDLYGYNYLNLIVSTISDFVCRNSDMCTYINYSDGDNEEICSLSCVGDDYSCVYNNNGTEYYYIVETYNGSNPLLLTQDESNDICNQYFNSSLASINTKINQEKIISLMEFYNSSNCWIGLNNVNNINPIFIQNNIQYFQWIDTTINSFNFIENTDNINQNGCVSISKSGAWIVNECNDALFNCFICNSFDAPTFTISSNKYHIINSIDTKSRDSADKHCMEHYNTHLSTIQSFGDQNDMLDILNTMESILKQNVSSIVEYQIDHNQTTEAWIGDAIKISYDDCIDYYDGRSFTEIWADGSSFNFTLLNYQNIIHQTCAPTISPTQNPSFNTTAFILLPNTTDNVQFEAPISPTKEPTTNPTLSPTIQIEKFCSISVVDGVWKTNDESTMNLWSCNVFDRAEYAIKSEDYYVFHTKNKGKTWIESDIYCESIFGTKLSTIYESADQNVIIKLGKQINASDMWIGMKLDDGQFSDGSITWTDGSKSNYSRLNSGCLVILRDAEIDRDDNSWIIDSCDDIQYSWSCNNFIPTEYPTISPTLQPTENIVKETYFTKVLNLIKSRPFETFYIILVSISLILTIFAFFHSKNLCFCFVACGCCNIHYADDARWSAIIVYGLQIWDFLSDCSFAYNLENRMSILFILSSSFILVPWICNICFLFIFRYQHSINNNFSTNKWFRDHSYKLVLITMLCGSANTSINLMNSRIFGLSLFDMGLTKLQLIETTKFKVILNTLLENIPQISCACYYMIITNAITDFAVMSLISSTLSVILVVVVSIIFSVDPLNDEYIEISLKYSEPLEIGDDNLFSDIETKLLKRFGLHKRIAISIAYSFGLNANLVTVDKHKYNIKNKSATLLVAINNNIKKEKETEKESRNNITDSLINKIGSKHATLMVIKLLESINCSAFANLFYQMNIIPLNKNGNKKLPISKKVKLDPNLMSDFTMFDEEEDELQVNSLLLRAGSSPLQSTQYLNEKIYDDHNDEDEILNIGAVPHRPISDNDDDVHQIEMVHQKSLNKQFSGSTRL